MVLFLAQRRYLAEYHLVETISEFLNAVSRLAERRRAEIRLAEADLADSDFKSIIES
jgi:hypothetical protein